MPQTLQKINERHTDHLRGKEIHAQIRELKKQGRHEESLALCDESIEIYSRLCTGPHPRSEFWKRLGMSYAAKAKAKASIAKRDGCEETAAESDGLFAQSAKFHSKSRFGAKDGGYIGGRIADICLQRAKLQEELRHANLHGDRKKCLRQVRKAFHKYRRLLQSPRGEVKQNLAVYRERFLEAGYILSKVLAELKRSDELSRVFTHVYEICDRYRGMPGKNAAYWRGKIDQLNECRFYRDGIGGYLLPMFLFGAMILFVKPVGEPSLVSAYLTLAVAAVCAIKNKLQGRDLNFVLAQNCFWLAMPLGFGGLCLVLMPLLGLLFFYNISRLLPNRLNDRLRISIRRSEMRVKQWSRRVAAKLPSGLTWLLLRNDRSGFRESVRILLTAVSYYMELRTLLKFDNPVTMQRAARAPPNRRIKSRGKINLSAPSQRGNRLWHSLLARGDDIAIAHSLCLA